MTTKEQERKALEKIKAIVDGLGENSYVATAFAGCFEIAEQNIEYDFADSYKERCENAEAELKKANEDITEYKKIIEETQKYQSRVLSLEDLLYAEHLIDDKIVSIKNEIQNRSELIVSLSENPETDDFKEAVRSHRRLLSTLSCYEELKTRVHNAL